MSKSMHGKGKYPIGVPNSHITAQQVSYAIEEAKSCKTVNELTNSIHSGRDDGWTEVKQRNRKPKQIIGTQIQSNGSLPMGIPKMAILHVSRLAPSTTSGAMKQYLAPNFPEAIVEDHQSRNPDKYISFKISIYEKNFKMAMNPEMWPQDCYVQRFFFRRKTTESTH
nr:unnamed protein product [Callosobruchus chinensis]